LHLTEKIWESAMRHLKCLHDDHCTVHCFFVRSIARFQLNILSRVPEILNEFYHRKLKLLWRGRLTGCSLSDFHRKCDGQSDTIALIQTTQNLIVGGHTPLPSDSTSGSKADSSHHRFNRAITHPNNVGAGTFTLKCDHSQLTFIVVHHMACVLEGEVRFLCAQMSPRVTTATRTSITK
jgi:hypothetical protein